VVGLKIYVDSRERKQIPLFQRYIDKKCKVITGMEVVTAQVSDVHDGFGNIGIERKGDDYVQSLFDGKLYKQLKELEDNFAYPFLFIEYDGIPDMISKNLSTNPGVIVGSITSILARHKVTVCFVGGLYISMTCKTIEKFYDLKNKVKEVEYTPIRRGATAEEVKLDIISRIPKVGMKKGRALLDHFGDSIGNISDATEEEIKDVAGFGKKLAREIKEIFE